MVDMTEATAIDPVRSAQDPQLSSCAALVAQHGTEPAGLAQLGGSTSTSAGRVGVNRFMASRSVIACARVGA